MWSLDLCDKQFTGKENLVKHLRRAHEGEGAKINCRPKVAEKKNKLTCESDQ